MVGLISKPGSSIAEPLDELTSRGCDARGAFEAHYPGDQNFEPRIKVPYVLMQCEDGLLYACTVTVETTVSDGTEIGLISNSCLPLTSKGL